MTTQLGQLVRQQRKALGLTQEQLAEHISGTDHVTQTDISRIELGKVKLPHYQRLHRLAMVLNLPLGALLAHSGWAGAEAAFANPAHSVLDHLTDACYLVDRDGRFTYVNQRAADLAGQTTAEMHGKTAWGQGAELHDAPVFAASQRAISEQVTVRLEHYDPSSDTWYASALYPSLDGLMVLTREISAHHRATINREDRIVEHCPQYVTTGRAGRADTQSSTDVSHELQCLATMIVGSVHLFQHHLNAGHEPDSPTLMQCLDTVEQTATRVADRLEPLTQTVPSKDITSSSAGGATDTRRK